MTNVDCLALTASLHRRLREKSLSDTHTQPTTGRPASLIAALALSATGIVVGNGVSLLSDSSERLTSPASFLTAGTTLVFWAWSYGTHIMENFRLAASSSYSHWSLCPARLCCSNFSAPGLAPKP